MFRRIYSFVYNLFNKPNYDWPEEDQYNPLEKLSEVEPYFWEKKSLSEMNDTEWELLCDGCGKCCLAKRDAEDKQSVEFTNVACRMLDLNNCRCKIYEHRKKVIHDCIKIDIGVIKEVPRWLPKTCAYWLLYNDKKLPVWHPLITNNIETVHEAGVSVKNRAISESDVKNIEKHIVNWDDL